MSVSTSKIGELGESVAATFLANRGYEILERNFQRPVGELDIIAAREELVFVEVKSVRCRIPEELPTEGRDEFRPEENVGGEKRARLRRIIQVYLHTHEKVMKWRCDLLCVYLDKERRRARVKWLQNIII